MTGLRPLICPICGVRLMLPTDGTLPAEFTLPDHEHGPNGNLCAGYRITVKFEYETCKKCGCNMVKHPSGLCMKCFGEGYANTQARH